MPNQFRSERESRWNMYYELYIDVFFLVNFMMDYILLLITKQMLHCSATHRSVCLGAAAGSLLTCIIVVLPLPAAFIKFILFHMFVNTCMIRAGLKIKNRRDFAKAYFLLYVGSFLLGGIMQSLQNYLRAGSLFFAIAIMGYYAVSKIWDLLAKVQRIESFQCQVDLYIGKKELSVRGIIDTGNQLCDPSAGTPVHILDRNEARKFLADESMKGIKYIPYHSIGKQGGVLMAIHIDRMRVCGEEECWLESPLIGISEETVSAEGEYKMILNPKAF